MEQLTEAGTFVFVSVEVLMVPEVFGFEGQYWIVVAGGKRDYTIKWWSPERWQAVVYAFRGRIQFVQVGALEDVHPLLDGVLDMRGKTTIREMIRLVYRASGVVCPVTFLMHLSAAVECAPGLPESRPCVVVAGGREAPHWEAYPTHQFIHTVGTLDCCRTGGCWRSRTVPLGDGDVKDRARNLCVDVVRRDAGRGDAETRRPGDAENDAVAMRGETREAPEQLSIAQGRSANLNSQLPAAFSAPLRISTPLPRCMDMISARAVIERVELYLSAERAEVRGKGDP